MTDALAALADALRSAVPLTLRDALLLGAAALLLGYLAGRLAFRRRLRCALRQSRAVLGGLAAEQVAPYLPGFPCNPADARFIGKPVDFVAFPGAAESDEIREVLFIEVKTGHSSLSPREKSLRRAIRSGRVRHVLYRLPARSGPRP